MDKMLDAIEVRVLGCLVEKDLATPEYYPLTLNALVDACNQKSNRDPVMQLSETEVARALDSLRRNQLAHQSAEGVRAAKYCHTLDHQLRLDPEELAVAAELMLRGPQTVGELRNRAERMCPLGDLQAVEQTLENLISRPEPLVARLERQPGRKGNRYAHLFSGAPEHGEIFERPMPSAGSPAAVDQDRLGRLEEEVASLRAEIGELRSQLRAFRAEFE